MKKQIIFTATILVTLAILTFTSCTKRYGCYYSLDTANKNERQNSGPVIPTCFEMCELESLLIQTHTVESTYTIFSN